MQLSMFEADNVEADNYQKGLEYVTCRILKSDSIRSKIKDSIKSNDRVNTEKYFTESISTFGFGIDDYTWGMIYGKRGVGELKDYQHKTSYIISAKELTDCAFRLKLGDEYE